MSGHKGFLTQAFVPSEGNVLRAVIIGRRRITYWKRSSNPTQPIVSAGAGARLDHDWRPELQERGKRAAASFARATGVNLAAIDFLFPSEEVDPEPLFLEVNYYFGRRGLGGAMAFYRLVYEALQEWLAGKGIDPKRVRLV
jgi:ribosomal protein S6--L-glutamate ligase